MKNIAIFVSKEGEATIHTASLFNEGNRIFVSLALAYDLSIPSREKISAAGVEILDFDPEDPEASWKIVAGKIEEKGIELIALDNFEMPLPDEIKDRVQWIINLSSPEKAPAEVVKAFRLMERQEEEKAIHKDEQREKTPDEEWAEALQINFTPPEIKETAPLAPPPLPDADNSPVETPPQIPHQPQMMEHPQRMEQPHQPRQQHDYYHQEEILRHREQRHENDKMPPTYLIWSVLTTIFCCFIPGIIAIIFSSQVSSKYFAGDYEGAWQSSRRAEIWIIVSFVLGVLSATLYLPIMLLS